MADVILVDLDDRPIGTMEKMEAHKRGLLHRAFSVFLFRGDEVLLQKRALSKYHCGGLWSNTCCSHPEPGEDVKEAAGRRLREELEIPPDAEQAPDLQEAEDFVYRQAFANGLTEFEYDHILIGEYDGSWVKNPSEVEEVRWIGLPELKADILADPAAYTPWFLTALPMAEEARDRQRNQTKSIPNWNS